MQVKCKVVGHEYRSTIYSMAPGQSWSISLTHLDIMHVNPSEASYIGYNIVLTSKQKVYAFDTIKLQLPNYHTHMAVWL